ncbi:MAG TPA: DUF4388 domain-containing protein [Acidimicrobiia bacterium]|nr:DUF4388 domain-containing protein [Acidimicrobiia bacterium]
MHLSGQLSDWSINDLLQIMQVTKKTGSLDIEGQRRGRVHFREGRVTGAELTGFEGAHAGSDLASVADILYVLSTVAEGSFSVGAADGPDAKGWTVEEVLVDVESLQTLEGEVAETGLFEANGVKLINEIGESVTLDPTDWQTFANLVPAFSFGALEARYGRGTAVRMFHTLSRMGLVEAVAIPEEEAEWLDRLAEGVAANSSWNGSDGETEVDTAAEPELEIDEEPIEPAAVEEPEITEPEPISVSISKPGRANVELKGVSAPASTTLTDGVYDEIRRLRSRVGEK